MPSPEFVETTVKAMPFSQRNWLSTPMSQTQVSKWRKGEYMSADMNEKMWGLSSIGALAPDLVLLVRSVRTGYKMG